MTTYHHKLLQQKLSSEDNFIYQSGFFRTSWHAHENMEITLVCRGQGTRYVGDRKQDFGEGDLVLLGSKIPHYWQLTSTREAAPQTKFIQFQPECYGKDFFHVKALEPIRKLLEDARRGIKFYGEASGRMAEMILEMENFRPSKQILSLLPLLEEMAYTHQKEFLLSEAYRPYINEDSYKRLDLIIAFIERHFDQRIRLDEIAQLVGMQKASLCRFFKRSTKRTITEFVTHYRIDVAKRQLIETNKTVETIAIESGFNSMHYFYQKFKAFVGSTPARFRKSYFRDFK